MKEIDKDDIAYKFNEDSTTVLSDLEGTKAYQIKAKLLRDEELTQDEADWLYVSTNGGKRSIKILGWCFLFCDFLNSYLVMTSEGNKVVYAYNVQCVINDENDKLEQASVDDTYYHFSIYPLKQPIYSQANDFYDEQ